VNNGLSRWRWKRKGKFVALRRRTPIRTNRLSTLTANRVPTYHRWWPVYFLVGIATVRTLKRPWPFVLGHGREAIETSAVQNKEVY